MVKNKTKLAALVMATVAIWLMQNDAKMTMNHGYNCVRMQPPGKSNYGLQLRRTAIITTKLATTPV